MINEIKRQLFLAVFLLKFSIKQMEKYSKTELRKKYLEKRKSLSDIEIKGFSEKIFNRVKEYFDLEKINNIHIFISSEKLKEVKTDEFIKFLWERGKMVFIPKVSGKELLCYELTKETILKPNAWSIGEPEGVPISLNSVSIDMVITPLVYCDKKGNRIGYGKGFYDRFLSKINRNALKVGVSIFTPNEEITDISPKDIALDYLVTSSEVFSFKSKFIK